MSGSPFGRWSLAAVAIALASVGVAWTRGGGAIFSPGALHAGDSSATRLSGITAHAALARRCDGCHSAPWGATTMAARCLDCHTDIQSERRDTSSLHGRIADVASCMACHTEHLGPRGALTRIDERAIAHDRFGFALATHRETAQGAAFACADCHPAGSYRFEGARCVDCHRDYQPEFVAAHAQEWGSDCLACHDGFDRFSPGVFDHGRFRFPLTGAHAEATCASCHVEARSFAGFGAAPSECIACHREDDEHRGDFGTDCAACHSTGTWSGARFEHEFPLDHGDEGRIACRTCHEDPTNWTSYTCYGCHEHTPARVRAQHREERIQNLDDCARCHPTGREHEERERSSRRRSRER